MLTVILRKSSKSTPTWKICSPTMNLKQNFSESNISSCTGSWLVVNSSVIRRIIWKNIFIRVIWQFTIWCRWMEDLMRFIHGLMLTVGDFWFKKITMTFKTITKGIRLFTFWRKYRHSISSKRTPSMIARLLNEPTQFQKFQRKYQRHFSELFLY